MNQPIEKDDVLAPEVDLVDKGDGLRGVAAAGIDRNGGAELEGGLKMLIKTL